MHIRFLRFPDLKSRGVDYSYCHLYRLERAGLFPKRRKLGPGRVGWLESEINAHISNLAP
jgi:prophage regulatory protein